MSTPGGATISADQLKARYIGTGNVGFSEKQGKTRRRLSHADFTIDPPHQCLTLCSPTLLSTGHADMSK